MRHKGIGSLPSAITTACSALTAELPGGEVFIWIALYNPASATTVSRTSSSLFIGGGLLLRILLRVRSICLVGASWAAKLVDNCRFLEDLCAVNWRRGRRGWNQSPEGKSLHYINNDGGPYSRCTNCGNSVSVAGKIFEYGRGPGDRRVPHPADSMPRYSMDLTQLIREVPGKRPLVRVVGQLCPLCPRHIHSVEDPA